MDMIGWAINPEKFLEPLQRQGGVARRVLDVAMPAVRPKSRACRDVSTAATGARIPT